MNSHVEMSVGLLQRLSLSLCAFYLHLIHDSPRESYKQASLILIWGQGVCGG